MGFKEDTQFARYLTMGAIGTAAVARDLHDRFGHRPIELERHAMANKVWAVKVKRLRIPDLVCVHCGRRIESKAKNKLEVKLSDSATAGREWWGGGMREEDLLAFIRVIGADGMAATPGRPGYFTLAGLRAAAEHARRGNRKALSEGSEVDLSWPAWVPRPGGTLIGLEDDAVIYNDSDGKRRRYWHSRKWPARHLYLRAGEEFEGCSTIVAGVIEPAAGLSCPGPASWDIARDLASADATDRYAAVKAAGIVEDERAIEKLRDIAREEGEDWRIALEAMASLARADEAARWIGLIREIASDAEREIAEQIEAVFVLSEIPAPEATEALASIAEAHGGRHEEVRAAAVWGLGAGALPNAERALAFVTDSNDRVSLHAAASAQSLSPAAIGRLRDWLREGDARKASIAAALLAHHGKIGELVDAAADSGDGRLWAIRALGDLPPDKVRNAAGDRLTPELRRALAPLWTQHYDWLLTPENEGALPLLSEQKLRFSPTDPGGGDLAS